MITIRPYQKKDFRYVQDICMLTSVYADDDTPINRAVICSMFCDYYLDNQSEFCFVAESDGKVVGYVLCMADLDDYYEKMSELYLPLIRKLDSGAYFKYSAETKLSKRYIEQGYTAHLHIDILPEYQHQGIGTQLINTLFDKLTAMCVEGVHLICGAKNTQARAFYEKCGMIDVDYITGAVVYGKKFFEE